MLTLSPCLTDSRLFGEFISSPVIWRPTKSISLSHMCSTSEEVRSPSSENGAFTAASSTAGMIRRRSQDISRQKYLNVDRARSYACCICGSLPSNMKTGDWDSLMTCLRCLSTLLRLRGEMQEVQCLKPLEVLIEGHQARAVQKCRRGEIAISPACHREVVATAPPLHLF